MSRDENNIESQLQPFMRVLAQSCTKLNSCIAQTEQIQINSSLSSMGDGLRKIVDKIVQSFKVYEKIMQNLQQNLRKHIKNQIELKLYYEHLEDVVINLKKQRQQNANTIYNLKTELTVLKQKQKYFMTNSNNNTKVNEDFGHFQSKLDTITKIKNRLSLNGTEQFYASYLAKKIDKQQDAKQLREKRQSLTNTLKQLYQSPIQGGFKNEKITQKRKKKLIDHPKQKQKQKQKNKSRVLRQSRSKKSLGSNQQHSHRGSQKSLQGKATKKQKSLQKDYIKSVSYQSSRRNSKC